MNKIVSALILLCLGAPLFAKIHEPKTMEEFTTLINKEGQLYLVDFYATWCGPCKMAIRDLPELDNKIDELEIIKINVDNNNFRDLKSQHVRSGIPMFIFMHNGNKVDEMIGYGGNTTPLEHKTQALLKRTKTAPAKVEAKPVIKAEKKEIKKTKKSTKKSLEAPAKPAPKAKKKTEKKETKKTKKSRKKNRKPKNSEKKQEKKTKKVEKKERSSKGQSLTSKSCKKCSPRTCTKSCCA